jgi:hypothetical protein
VVDGAIGGSRLPRRYDLLIAIKVNAKTAKNPTNPPKVLRSPPSGSTVMRPLRPIASEVRPMAGQIKHIMTPTAPRMVTYLLALARETITQAAGKEKTARELGVRPRLIMTQRVHGDAASRLTNELRSPPLSRKRPNEAPRYLYWGIATRRRAGAASTNRMRGASPIVGLQTAGTALIERSRWRWFCLDVGSMEWELMIEVWRESALQWVVSPLRCFPGLLVGMQPAPQSTASLCRQVRFHAD